MCVFFFLCVCVCVCLCVCVCFCVHVGVRGGRRERTCDSVWRGRTSVYVCVSMQLLVCSALHVSTHTHSIVSRSYYSKTLVSCYSSAAMWKYMLLDGIMKRACLCGQILVLFEIMIFAIYVSMQGLPRCSRSICKNVGFLFFECTCMTIHVGWSYHEEAMFVWSRLSTAWNHNFCPTCIHVVPSMLTLTTQKWFFLFFECSYVKIHVGWCYHEEGMLVWSRLSTTWNHDFCSICTHAGASTLLTLKMPWGFKALDAFTCMLLSSPEWHCRLYRCCVQFLDIYVYIYICIYIHIYIYMYIYIHIYTHLQSYTQIHLCIHRHRHVYI